MLENPCEDEDEDEALCLTVVVDWFKQLIWGGENLEDEPRSGRLSTVRNPETIAKTREIVARESRVTLKVMED